MSSSEPGALSRDEGIFEDIESSVHAVTRPVYVGDFTRKSFEAGSWPEERLRFISQSETGVSPTFSAKLTEHGAGTYAALAVFRWPGEFRRFFQRNPAALQSLASTRHQS